MTEIDLACQHAYELLREHVEKYRTDILCEPSAWRARCRELFENLEWLEFCRDRDMRPCPPPPSPLKR
jgi:hypothetical protein